VTDIPTLYAFPIILAMSLVGCIAGTLLTPPDSDDVVDAFYLKVRPWGFWGPVHDRLKVRHPQLRRNEDFARDMANVAIGIAWQTSLTALGIFLVLQQSTGIIVSALIAIVSMAILKRFWYDRLQDHPDDLAAEATLESSRSASTSS
jgi:SSS family solute:Na+ symporter